MPKPPRDTGSLRHSIGTQLEYASPSPRCCGVPQTITVEIDGHVYTATWDDQRCSALDHIGFVMVLAECPDAEAIIASEKVRLAYEAGVLSASWDDRPVDIVASLQAIREAAERSCNHPPYFMPMACPAQPKQPSEPTSTDALRDLCKDAGVDGGARFTSEGGFRLNPSEN